LLPFGEIKATLIVGRIIASQAVREYPAMLPAALNVGVTPVETRGIVYRAIPYVGLAKVSDARSHAPTAAAVQNQF
jgi:4-carboxymuconolactone decarboxylase